jgi:hypothetical protein
MYKQIPGKIGRLFTPRDQKQEAIADGDDGGSHNDRSHTAVFLSSNTFADELAQKGHLKKAFDIFGVELPLESLGDIPFGRDPTRIERTLTLLEDDIENALLRLSQEADYVIAPTTVGTGYMAYRWANIGRQFQDMIDLVIPSHKTDPEKLETHAQNAILAGIGHSMIEPPVVLFDHRHSEPGMTFSQVAPEAAKALVAQTLTDMTNRRVGYWTMSYEHIPLGGIPDMQIGDVMNDAVVDADPWVSTRQWAPWSDQDQTVPVGEPDSFIILPSDVEVGFGDQIRVIKQRGVTDGHLLKFWPVERNWFETHVRWGGIEFIDEQIRNEKSRIAMVWEDHASPRDPITEWERLRETYINPRLPER